MNLILHKDTVYEPVESQFYSGYQPVKLTEGEPTLTWKGGKIPTEEWQKILSFFKWSYDETKSETQVRLLYNPETSHWVAWAFPQEHGKGMLADEIDGDEKDKQREQFPGYTVAGTVHHHCSSPAFQSGTDKADEKSQDGVHLTVGKLDSATYDLHSRVCRSDVIYSCSLKQWFEYPPEWDGIIPAKYINHAVADTLVTPVSDVGFPEQWKDNLIKIVKTYPATQYYNRGHHTGNHCEANYWRDTGKHKRTTFSSPSTSTKLPEHHTEKEKEEGIVKAVKDWLFKYGDELKAESIDLPNEWDRIILSHYYTPLSDAIDEYQIDEFTFEKVCDAIQEAALQKEFNMTDQEKPKTLEDNYYSHNYGYDA